MQEEKLVQIEDKGRIRYLILNRPEKRNALNAQLVGELKIALQEAIDSEDVKVIVFKAMGEAFSAGADLDALKKLQTNTFEENLADSQHLMELFLMMYESPKMLIAQVEGHAIAGGCGLATHCDFVFSVPNASYGYTEVKIGFIPAIVMVFLLRKLGEARAKELLLTGDLISASKAQEIGLINYVVDSNEIDTHVYEFAERMCQSVSANSIQMTRQMMAIVQNLSYKDALNYAAEMNANARSSKDCQAGISAFLNKQKLKW